MNKTYRIVWNDARQTYVVASEVATSRGKPASTVKRVATVLAGTMMAHQVLAAPSPNALPSGGQVVSGEASVSQSGSNMNIQQGSDKAILNWQSFNIGSNAAVNFQQPGSGSVALNRVTGNDPSAIYGTLTSNGQVFLVNPNGVLFGQGARVDVGGMVASTLDIRNEDFLDGTYRFNRSGATGSVVNQGELYGKYIALLAPKVRNEGVIAAREGTVTLAAGDAVTLSITGNRLIDVAVDQASIDTLVENKHLVQADDGTVIMSAQSANELVGQVVNSGTVEAQGIVNDGGVVRLLASDSIDHSGTINVDSSDTGNGGEAILLASLSNPNSTTDVTGSISARGGSDAGDGGFIETSGSHLSIGDTAYIDTRAANGKTGSWLLDPEDFTVAASGGDITGSTLSGLLLNSDVTIETGSISGAVCLDGFGPCGVGLTGTNGDIFINDAVSWSAPTSLTLSAYRNIEVNSTITASDAASAIYMMFGQEVSGVYKTGASGSISNGSGGDPTVYAPDGTLLTGAQLQASYTSNPTAFVILDAGQSSTYGDVINPNYTAYDQIDLFSGTLSTLTTGTGGTWKSAPLTALSSTTSAGTASYVYAGGLPNTSYYFIPAGPESWTVNKATVSLSAAAKTYDGSATPGTVTINGVNGETLNYSSATAASANVGGPDGNTGTADNYISAITLTDGTGLASNYQLPTLNAANALVTINKADLTLSGSRSYDGSTTVAGSTLTATGVNGETFAVTGAGDTSNLSGKDASATPQALNSVTGLALGTSGNGGLASNYNGISTTGSSYTINKATLTYTADAQNITEGDAIPDPLAGTVTGFVNSESQATATTGTLTFTTNATSSSPADSYAINGSGLSATNYNFVQAASNATALTINAATNYDSIAQLIAALLKQQETGTKKHGSLSLAGMQSVYSAFAKYRGSSFGTDFLDKLKSGAKTDTEGLVSLLSGLARENCPTCTFTKDAYKEWLSGGTGKASAGLADVWKLQYKAALDKGVKVDGKKVENELFVKAKTFKSMKSLGYTAKDFKNAGFDISQFIVLENSFPISKDNTETDVKKFGMWKYATTKNTKTYTTVGRLAFTQEELLKAGYTKEDIARATEQAKEKSYSYKILGSTESHKSLNIDSKKFNNGDSKSSVKVKGAG